MAEKVTPTPSISLPNATSFAKPNNSQRKPQRIKRQRNTAYPHAEVFLVVIVGLRSYKITFLTPGAFQWLRRQQNDAHGHQSISAR